MAKGLSITICCHAFKIA
uniref:Uncharacterized protein n=1 Tax=Moniliophthora roreri TaxID=221103 RepID=A0A0W0FKK1_MONRR